MNTVVAAHENFVLGRPKGARALLRMVVAPRMQLDKRTLRDSDFTGAHLEGSTFRLADLERAAFYCASLDRCDFRGANLRRSDLRGSSLSGANLSGAVLDEADIRSAVLYHSDSLAGIRRIGGRTDQDAPTGARSSGASDEVIDFSVDFTNCSLRGARLKNANLKNANFSEANLDGADLSGAKLAGAVFHSAIMTGIPLSKLNFERGQLEGCVLDPTPAAMAMADRIRVMLDQAETWINSQGRNGARAVLDDMDLRPAGQAFHERILPALSARKVCAIGVNFFKAQLQGANFEGADLRGADFTGADLRGVSFRDAKLAHARFAEADLGPLPLQNGKSRPVDVAGATLDGTGLLRAAPPPVPSLSLAI